MFNQLFENINFLLFKDKNNFLIFPFTLVISFLSGIFDILSIMLLGAFGYALVNNQNNVEIKNKFLEKLLDINEINMSFESLSQVIYLLIGLFLLKFFLNVLSNYLRLFFISKQYSSKTANISNIFLNMKHSMFSRFSQEEFSKNINYNLEKSYFIYSNSFLNLLNEIIISFFLILTVYLIIGLKVFIALTIIIILSFFLLKILKKFSLENFEKQIHYVGNLFKLSKDLHGLFKEILISRNQKKFSEILYKSFFKNSKYLKKYLFFQTSFKYFYELFIVSFFLISIFFILKSNNFAGYEKQNLVYLGMILLRFYPNFSKIANNINVLNSLEPMCKELIVFYNRIKDSKTKQKSKKIEININVEDFKIFFEDVSFNYDKKKIFNKLNFVINKGDKILIQGPSGSGKSTFINLLTGIINPISGKVWFNDNDYKEINIDKNFFGYISQNPFFINDTIENNISINKNKNFENSKMLELIKFCDLEKLNKQRTTYENISGVLSGGEKQKIAFARALYNSSNFLIFDEPTTGFDKDYVYKFFDKILLLKNKTVVIITHEDISNLKNVKKFRLHNNNLIQIV